MACATALPTLSAPTSADNIVPPTILADGSSVRLPHKHVRRHDAHENKNGIHRGVAQGSPAFMFCNSIFSVDQGRATRGVRRAITFATKGKKTCRTAIRRRCGGGGGNEHTGSVEGASTRQLSAGVGASSTTAEITIGSTQPHGRRSPSFNSQVESTAVASNSVRPTRQQPRALATASTTASGNPDAPLPPHAAGCTTAVATGAASGRAAEARRQQAVHRRRRLSLERTEDAAVMEAADRTSLLVNGDYTSGPPRVPGTVRRKGGDRNATSASNGRMGAPGSPGVLGGVRRKETAQRSSATSTTGGIRFRGISSTCASSFRPETNRSREFVKRVKTLPLGDWKAALRELEAAERESPRILNNGNKFNGVNGVTVYMYHSCINVLAKNGRWREAREVLKRMRRSGVTPNVHCVTAALNAHVVAGEGKRALELLNTARSWGFEENSFSYNVVLSGLSKSKLWIPALRLFRDMQASGVTPDAFTYNAVITACGNGGQWERSFELLRDMDSMGVRANSFCYNSVIAACAKAGQSVYALALLNEMTSRGIEPTVVSYNSAITACGNDGRWKEALRLLEEMPSLGLRPDCYSYNSAIQACSDAGQCEEALSLLRKMPIVGVRPTISTYNSVLTACANTGQWQQALTLLEEIPSVGLSPMDYTYTAAVAACGRAGQWEQALKLLRGMTKTGVILTVSVYNAAIAACGDAHQVASALELWEEMQWAGLSPNLGTYNAVIAACASAGRWEQSLAFLRDMEAKQSIHPNTASYNSVIGACGRAGRWEVALELFEGMRAVPGVAPSAATYVEVITACGDNRQWRKAVTLFRQMLQTATASNGGKDASTCTEYGEALSAAIVACGKADEWEEACSILKEVSAAAVTSPALFTPENIRRCKMSILSCGNGGRRRGRVLKALGGILDGVSSQSDDMSRLAPRYRGVTASDEMQQIDTSAGSAGESAKTVVDGRQDLRREQRNVITRRRTPPSHQAPR